MTRIRIELEGAKDGFRPGEVLAGTATWHLEVDPERIAVRLFWYTEGKGDQDLSVVDEVVDDSPSRSGSLAFRFTLPPGPYSFSGRLISLVWALETIADPAGTATREEIVVGPRGREIRIDREASADPR